MLRNYLDFKIIYKIIIEKKRSRSSLGFLFYVVKKVLYKIYMQLLFLPAAPFAGILFLLRPLVTLKFVRLPSDSIGHFALDTALLVNNVCDTLSNRTVLVIYSIIPGAEISNIQLYKMWRRALPIIPFPALISRVEKIASLFLKEYKRNSVNQWCDNFAYSKFPYAKDLLDKYPRKIDFTQSEQLKGDKILERLGVPLGSQFVCLFVRDDAYKIKKYGCEIPAALDRNADIANYKKAALYLAKTGYYVLRMGKVVGSQFDVEHANVIDYANHTLRSDFMDIYLSAHCYFYMSTASGLDGVAAIFKRPILLSNFTKWCHPANLNFFTIMILRDFIDGHTGEHTSFKSLLYLLRKIEKDPIRVKMQYSYTLDEIGISYYENSEDQILAAVMEMLNFLAGEKNRSAELEQLEKTLWSQYREVMELDFECPARMKVRIGADYLIRNKNMLISSVSEVVT